MHTVNGDFTLRLRQSALQDTCLIDPFCFGINADGSVRHAVIVVILILIPVKILIQLYRNLLKVGIVQLILLLCVRIFLIYLVLNFFPCLLVRLVVCLWAGLLVCCVVSLAVGAALPCLFHGGLQHRVRHFLRQPLGDQYLSDLRGKLLVKLRCKFGIEFLRKLTLELIIQLPLRLVQIILLYIGLPAGFNGGEQSLVRPGIQFKMPVLQLVLFHAVTGCLQHAAVGNIHAGHKADRQDQEQAYHQIFFPVSRQFSRNAFVQRIFYPALFLFRIFHVRHTPYHSRSTAEILLVLMSL